MWGTQNVNSRCGDRRRIVNWGIAKTKFHFFARCIATLVHSTYLGLLTQYIAYIHTLSNYCRLWGALDCVIGNPELQQVRRVGPKKIEGESKDIPLLCMFFPFGISSRGLCAFVLLVVAMWLYLLSRVSFDELAFLLKVEKAISFCDRTQHLCFRLWMLIKLSKHICVWSNSGTYTGSDCKQK